MEAFRDVYKSVSSPASKFKVQDVRWRETFFGPGGIAAVASRLPANFLVPRSISFVLSDATESVSYLPSCTKAYWGSQIKKNEFLRREMNM